MKLDTFTRPWVEIFEVIKWMFEHEKRLKLCKHAPFNLHTSTIQTQHWFFYFLCVLVLCLYYKSKNALCNTWDIMLISNQWYCYMLKIFWIFFDGHVVLKFLHEKNNPFLPSIPHAPCTHKGRKKKHEKNSNKPWYYKFFTLILLFST